MDHQPIEEEKWGDVSSSQTERLVISEAVHKLSYGRGRSGGSSAGISVILLSSLMITAIFRSACDQTGGDNAEVSALVFTDGEDTRTFSGIISADRHQVRFSCIRLAVESDIVITQLVNITSVGFSDCALKISVGAEDFGTELSSLKIYLVSPSGIETLAVEFDDLGNVITENVLVSVPQKEEWSIKLAGHYYSGTSISQSNSLTLHFQVTW